jgi:hypothetical protein
MNLVKFQILPGEPCLVVSAGDFHKSTDSQYNEQNRREQERQGDAQGGPGGSGLGVEDLLNYSEQNNANYDGDRNGDYASN